MNTRFNTGNMLRFTLLLSVLFYFVSCSPQEDGLQGKLDRLDQLKAEYSALGTEIKALEESILQESPDALDAAISTTLVTTYPLHPEPFAHYLTVRGNVESRTNVVVSAEMMGRVVQSYVQEGSKVMKGQRILRLDGSVLENNKAELSTALELAKTVFERQARLWEQNIGTEIQYLEAKNNVESLERRLSTLQSEMDKLEVRAPFTGTIDRLLVKEGEMLSPGAPVAQFTGNSDMYINAEVSERFVGRFAVGDPVEVFIPTLGLQMASKISAVGSTLNANNRTFTVEVRLDPLPENVKSNMIATVKLQDYYNPEALSIPANLIMQDRIGKYVWKVAMVEGKETATKAYIQTGNMSDQMIEVLDGLGEGDQIVDKGYREMNEGMFIRIASN